MKGFKEVQFAWWMIALMTFVFLFITYLYINKIGDRPISQVPYFIIMVVNLIILILFYGMTTEIDDAKITIRFGIGIIRKRIAIQNIKHVETVKNQWYYGWGIRFIPGGMLYNISGLKGVELTFYDTKRIVRIGTKVTESLKAEIESRLTK